FRHVLDLTREQIARGHRVGLIADRRTGGARADEVLREIAPSLALGLTRVPMRRHAGPGDVVVLAHVMRRIAQSGADVVHGHGAKGGAYARMAFNYPRAARAYTPHGGSLLFGHDSLAGKIYLTTEKLLMLRGDLFLFESAYSEQVFRLKIGSPRGLVRIVHNGVSRKEFGPVETQPDATDLVFMGELRSLKGIDILIDAIALLKREDRSMTATLDGDGPDREELHAQVERLGLSNAIRFMPAMPARQAQSLGRVMVVPSRFESLPYVVLEAAAAGRPLIATKVGGIPEIYGPLSDALVSPNNIEALAQAIARAMDQPDATADLARKLRERVAASFSVENMVDGVLTAYQTALAALQAAGRR
ncbi:MAG TPA: glycosyltransferase family 4 protein, partial [Pseudolabrys sp.]|nr:glycosyltransferase family 4 protein [Pseudolabrys sp.]